MLELLLLRSGTSALSSSFTDTTLRWFWVWICKYQPRWPDKKSVFSLVEITAFRLKSKYCKGLLSSVIIKSRNWKPPSSTFQQLAKRKKRAIITIEEPNVSLVYASENVKVSTIENEEEESSKTGMYFRVFLFVFINVLPWIIYPLE